MHFCKRVIGLLLPAAMLMLALSACIVPAVDDDIPQTRDLRWGVGAPLPTAADFFTAMPEGYTAAFAEEYSFSNLGDYTLKVVLTTPNGTQKTYSVNFTMILDTEAPKIIGAKDLSVYIGDGVSYRSGVSVADNCNGKTTLTVNSSAVDTTKEGAYPVVYTATDAVGNTSQKQITVYVYREAITQEMLNSLLDPIIQANIPTAGSIEQQVRAVYQYVYYNISYVSTSDKNDWVRAAYDGLRTGQGDCYTYFAVSKAFFERLGIENMDIQRTEGVVDERHYWNFVNIGTAQSPRWYHFDACRLSGVQHSGCLLTDVQVQAYTAQRAYDNGVTGYFYAYNTAAYPASAGDIITQTPSLEPYY